MPFVVIIQQYKVNVYINIDNCSDNNGSVRQQMWNNASFIHAAHAHFPRGGGELPYLDMVGRFSGDDPRFGDFQSDWVPILYLITIRLTPLSEEKISLSLSHLVPEILGPKFGLIFHQNVLCNIF